MRNILFLFLLLVPFGLKAQLNADFSFNNAAGCSPLIVNFTDLSTGNITNWQWSFGNGNGSNQANPGAVYTVPGLYDVSLAVSDDNGITWDTMFAPDAILVYEDPIISFTSDVTSGCAPLEVQFTNTTVTETGIASIFWNFGDGNTSNLLNPSNTFALGLWEISVLVTDSAGCESQLVEPDYIDALAGPTANFSVGSNVNCVLPVPIQFTNTSINDAGATYLWDFGDASPTSTMENPIHNYNNYGTYDVTLIVDVNGCIDTIRQIGAADIQPQTASFDVDTNSICQGEAINFMETSIVPGTSWNWDFGDGGTSMDQNPTHTYDSSGTYTVIFVSTIGGCSDSMVMTNLVSVDTLPEVGFTSDVTSNCNPPFTVNFMATGDTNVSYVWDFTDGGNPAIPNPSHTFFNGGNFTVTLTVTNDAGCSNSFSQPDFITISDPIPDIIADTTSGCEPLTVNFMDGSISSGTVDTWFWDFGDGSPISMDMNPTHVYTDSGEYYVSLIIVDDLGCTDTLIDGQFIDVGVPIELGFEAAPLLACKSEEIIFDNQSDTTNFFTTWNWSFGDGGTDNAQDPIYAYADTGTFDVTLSANNYGCISDTVIEDYITILPPIALFDITYNCDDVYTVQFDDMSIEADTWLYVSESGDSIAAANTSITFPSTGDFDVTLYVSNDSIGCVDSLTQVVRIRDVMANFTQDTTIGCPILPISFTNLSVNSNSNLWDFGDASTSGIVNPTHNYTSVGLFDVQLIATDIHGCSDTMIQNALINTENVTSNFVADTTIGCRPFTATFQDLTTSIGGSIVSWEWNFGDGSPVSNSPNPTHVYQDVGIYSVSLEITNQSGCISSVTFDDYIEVIGPVPNFTVPGPVCINGDFTIMDNSTGSNLTYNWNFGDGSPINNSVNPTHAYSNVGSYQISLTLMDDNLCDTTFVSPDSVLVETIDVGFTASDTIDNCPPFAVNFTEMVTPAATSWLWDFGDGGSSTLATPSYIYNSVDTFTVSLIATTAAGCQDSFVIEDYIVVSGPFGDVESAPEIGCEDLTVTFELSNSNTTNQIWDFGDGFVQDTTPIIDHIYTDVGTYYPLVVLTDSGGCTIFYPVDSVIVSSLDADFSGLPNYVCTPDAVTFTDLTTSADPIISHFWDFGTGDTSNLPNPVYTYNQDGVFDVQLIVDNGFCMDTVLFTQYIVSDSSLNAEFSFDIGDACPPIEVPFTDLSVSDSSIISWNWNTGNGVTSNMQNPSVLYDTAGTYSVSMIVATTAGCIDTFVTDLVVNPLPEIMLSTSDTVLCVGEEYAIDSIGSDSYVWTPSTYLSCDDCPNPTLTELTSPDMINYNVFGANQFGCLDTADLNVTILNNPNVQVSQDEVVLQGAEVQMSVFASGNVNFVWSPDSLLDCSTCPNPNYLATQTQTFSVSVQDTNNCTSSEMVTITVYQTCSDAFLKFPNIFTPNNDGKNETFKAYRLQNLVPEIKSMRIFNRWGKVIYQTNDIEAGWDGTFNGTPVNNGVYVYTLEIVCFDGSTELKQGNVTLIR